MSYGASMATAYSKPFWEGVAEGKLRIQRCESCGHHQDLPQPRCRNCLGESLTWVETDGIGTLHSFSTVHRAPSPEFAERVPYVVGMIRLPEGRQVLGLLVVDDESELSLDIEVRACLAPEHGSGPVLGFAPVGSAPVGSGPQT